MITKIDTLDNFNQLFINFTDQQKSDFFLPCDSMVNDALVNNRIEELRIILENPDNGYDYYENLYNLKYSPLTEEQYTTSSCLVYPYSKKSYFKTFFNQILPSLSNHVFSYMKATGRVVQIGTGQGKGLIIFPSPFTEDDLQFLNPIQYQQVIDSIVSITSLVNNQQADIKFLLEHIEELKSINENLSLEHQQMQNVRVQDYLTTWR